jgi:hypothetical protein
MVIISQSPGKARGMDTRGDDRRVLGGVSRRAFLAAGSAAFATGVFKGGASSGASDINAGFSYRGYYITFMRMPTYGLRAWKRAVDCFASDGVNLLVLWMAGGFRSKKFPETWKYNEAHENVRADFATELIRYAHAKGIKVLLGFTPFGYDGVNQYSLDRPELRAVKKDGAPADQFGIHCWGWNLCPSKAPSQRFMREYVREMCFDFYPESDGLLIESSDYAICHCADCRGRYYEREFELVRGVSDELWESRRDAMIVVYPHYFSGSKVPGLDAEAAREPFDPRWTLFFTPHSAHVDRELIRRSRASIWSDDAPALRDPQTVRLRAGTAREAGVTGYVPSLEAFSYVPTHAEEGRQDLIGKRQIPFGFGWLKADETPYDELPVRVNRVAFREFSKDPTLSFDEFKQRLGRDVFGADAQARWVDDLLLLERVFFQERTWCQPSPLASPERVRVEAERGRAGASTLAAYAATLREVEEMTGRHADSSNPGRRDLNRIGRWVLEQWTDANRKLLKV